MSRGAGSIVALATLLVLPPLAFAQSTQQSGTTKSPDPTPDAAAPLSDDLSGVWMQYPEGVVKGVPGMNAIDESLRPPLTPWGQAKYDAAFAMQGPRAVAGKENAPTLHCDPDGPPRVLNLPNPFEIIQIPGRTFMFYELGHVRRTIWTNGRPLPKDPDPTWLGYSVGKWDGDTFVVDTIGFNDKAWVDNAGRPHSDALHTIERYRRRNFGSMDQTITFDDPKAYTKPWTVNESPARLVVGQDLLEYVCTENNKDIEHLFGDGQK